VNKLLRRGGQRGRGVVPISKTWCLRYKEQWCALKVSRRPRNPDYKLKVVNLRGPYFSRAVRCGAGKGWGGLIVFEFAFRRPNCTDCIDKRIG